MHGIAIIFHFAGKLYGMILSYRIRHGYDISGFLLSYLTLLQRSIDIVWDNIKWVELGRENYSTKDGDKRVERR